jgi:adenine deaminase
MEADVLRCTEIPQPMSRMGPNSAARAMASEHVSGSGGGPHRDIVRKKPTREEFIIRGTSILTMASTGGDVLEGDIHVNDGVIAGVGRSISSPSAKIIDAKDMIVAPGLVDTHWHMWTS